VVRRRFSYTVKLLLHCDKYFEARSYLDNTFEEIFPHSEVKFSVSDKVKMVVAPPCDGNIQRNDDSLILKEALFEFIYSVDRGV